MVCSTKQLYTVVVHKPTGRAFTLDRSYGLLNADIADYKTILVGTSRIVSAFDGWVPTGDWQRPEWIEGKPDAEFHAFWLDH